MKCYSSLLLALVLVASACTKEQTTTANAPSSSDPNQASPESAGQGRPSDETDGVTDDRMGPASPGPGDQGPPSGPTVPPP